MHQDSSRTLRMTAGQVSLVVAAAALGWFFDAVVLNIYTVALPQITRDFALSVGTIGIIGSLFLAGYGLGTLFGGTFADYVGRRTSLGISILGYTIFSALTALAPNGAVFGALRFLTGVGCGSELPVGAAYVAEVVEPKHRGFFVCMMNSVFSLGLFLAIGLMAVFHNWRFAFASLLVIGVAIYALRSKAEESPRFLEVARARAGTRMSMGETIKQVFSERYRATTLRIMLLWIGYWVAWWGWSIFVPRYLISTVGVAPDHVLWIMGCYAMGAFVVQLSIGWFCDVLGRKTTIALFSLLALGFAWWWTAAAGTSYGVVLGGFAFALMLAPPGALVTSTTEQFPTAIRGTGQSFTIGIARLISIAAPGFGGFLAVRLGQSVEMRIVTLFLLVSVVAALFGTETRNVALEDHVGADASPASGGIAVAPAVV